MGPRATERRHMPRRCSGWLGRRIGWHRAGPQHGTRLTGSPRISALIPKRGRAYSGMSPGYCPTRANSARWQPAAPPSSSGVRSKIVLGIFDLANAGDDQRLREDDGDFAADAVRRKSGFRGREGV